MRWDRKWRSNKRAKPCLPELGVGKQAGGQGGRETEGEKVVDRGASGVRRKKG